MGVNGERHAPAALYLQGKKLKYYMYENINKLTSRTPINTYQ
jgi:hypothetical protein